MSESESDLVYAHRANCNSDAIQTRSAMGEVSASVVTGETCSTSPRSEKRGGRRRVTAVELLIIVQAMARLMCDVDMAEQA